MSVLRLFFLFSALFVPSFVPPGFLLADSPLFSWVQAAPGNVLSVRSIVTHGQNCPTVTVDGSMLPMQVRAVSNDDAYPTTCALSVPRNSKHIAVEQMDLPILPERVNKVAIVGDTGCRISYIQQQVCNLENEWPFKKNAMHIAEHKPDLVIHVGDLLYRKSSCRDKKKCGTVYGYNWPAWRADWFDPARELFSRAPMLFVRGNHEDCERAYEGWFEYFDPRPLSKKCDNFSESWFFNVGPVNFFVFDSSFGSDSETSEYHYENLRQQLSPLWNAKDSNIWFLTHRPLWHYAKRSNRGFLNVPQVEAFADVFPPNVSVVLSGHIHTAQVLEVDQHPTQVVAGNGGTLLDQVYDVFKLPVTIGGFTVNNIVNIPGYGFAIAILDENVINFYTDDNFLVYSYHLKS